MKKIFTVAGVLLCCISLAGCGKNDISLTTEQNDLVAEYIAGTLLKYSYENEWKYQKLNSAGNTYTGTGNKNTTQVTQQSTQAAGDSVQQTTQASQSQSTTQGSMQGTSSQGTASSSASADLLAGLPEALGLNGVTLTYKDYVTGSSYPADSYSVSVPAQSGCEVVAVELKITNTSGSDITLNSSGSAVIKLTTGGKSVNNSASLLKNDITALKNYKLSSGESKDVVIIFQVKESDANSIAGSVMSATSSGTSLGSLTIN